MKFSLLILLACLSLVNSNAQAPQGIPYQSVIRNGSGALMINQAIHIRFSIHDSTMLGTVVYQEIHTVTTSNLGMVTVAIGQGTPSIATFSSINWGSGAKFMQVELDAAGGSNYTDLGTQQMMSVPYALHAGNGLPNGNHIGDVLSWNGYQWVSTSISNIPQTPIAVGMQYQGGIIAYILQPGDPGYDANDVKGFIAAPNDQSTGMQWYNGSYVTTGATATALGTGNTNTNAIVSVQGAGSYAAQLCYDLVLNGYSDWYLPSQDELNKLYLNQTVIGGFAAAFYWSSSEYDLHAAWSQPFSNGGQGLYDKSVTTRVRAIRTFSLSNTTGVTTNSVTSIQQTTATCGGSIVSQGGASVTARGVCWSTTANPTVALSTKTTDGSGTGSFTSNITGLTPDSTYYVRAYAISSAGTVYGNEITFTTASSTAPALAIGQSYQGGIIAYILQPGDPGYDPNDVKGLIAAPSDQGAIQWWNGSYVTTGATATAIGTGNANTSSIVSVQGAGSYAAKLCYDLVLNGYGDWYLPSKDELNKLYLNKTAIGSFAAAYYWSSSEVGGDAWLHEFGGNYQGHGNKGDALFVRAIRSFSTSNTTGVTTNSVTSIQQTTATCGGSVVSQGGASVTARGVCWSTTANPTVALSTKTTDGSGTGSFTSNITGLTPDSTYYVRAYATSSVGTVYGNEITFTTATSTTPSLAIGQSYQGGIIAYILQPGDPGYDPNDVKGFIAAPNDQSTGIVWWNGYNGITGATATIIGAGNANTNTIVSVQGNGTYAAQLCYDLVLNGYSDWYLPSKDELNTLYLNRAAIGGLAAAFYWSSSEHGTNNAWSLAFFDGSQQSNAKYFAFYVRAIRSFSTSNTTGVTTNPVTSIQQTTATCGGSVVSQGGASVTARGVCWSTTPNPTVALSTKTTDGSGTGSFTSNITGLTPDSTYYVRAYATSSAGTVYGNEFTFTTASSTAPSLAIGQSYQGGIIAYILQPGDPGYDPNDVKGLIAAPNDQSTGAQWGCQGTVLSGADGTAIGTGNQNTIDIMNGCSTAGIAARICGDLVLNGYSDWYLPSKDELNKLYLNQTAIGGFAASWYWSSSESGTTSAWIQAFFGFQNFLDKSTTFCVRAVRAFSTSNTTGVTTNSVTSIQQTTATCGGSVVSQDSASVTARGVCWSTTPNPTVALSTKTTDGSGTGNFTSNITGLTPDTTYYVRAYATSSVGTVYGNEITFTTATSITPTLAIGQSYEGGIIAYILQPGDPGYDANVPHGLIAAPNDQSTGIQWYNGTYVTTSATATALGTGNANTNTIVSVQGNGTYAAQLCYDLVLNGYSDWYLPSKDELNKLYLNQTVIGGFAAAYYWSSSDNYGSDALDQDFSNGGQSSDGKYNPFYVRAVRAF